MTPVPPLPAGGDPSPGLTDLDRLCAVQELRLLKARFCRYVGARAWRDLERLFTPQGQARVYDTDGRLVLFADGAEIAPTLEARIGRAQTVLHAYTDELTITSPTSADGLWAMEDRIVFPGDEDDPPRWMHGYGHFHETYERHGSRWLIRSLELTRVRVDHG
ncbi:nuclear transport factor 2 family protein [Mumia sp. DW29H23]|uniref:nuclear transport factor 2 family protein n=1 Tax=Mumia sp. DW29H23 TaxID=3421241 RepID=UPI003D69227C